VASKDIVESSKDTETTRTTRTTRTTKTSKDISSPKSFKLPVDWLPYPFQLPLWRYLYTGSKKAIAIWYRRAGKDMALLSVTLVSGKKYSTQVLYNSDFIKKLKKVSRNLGTPYLTANTNNTSLDSRVTSYA
jgi:hypothetical protein